MKNKRLKNVFISAGVAVFAGVLLLGVNAAIGADPSHDPPGTAVSPTFSGLNVEGVSYSKHLLLGSSDNLASLWASIPYLPLPLNNIEVFLQNFSGALLAPGGIYTHALMSDGVKIQNGDISANGNVYSAGGLSTNGTLHVDKAMPTAQAVNMFSVSPENGDIFTEGGIDARGNIVNGPSGGTDPVTIDDDLVVTGNFIWAGLADAIAAAQSSVFATITVTGESDLNGNVQIQGDINIPTGTVDIEHGNLLVQGGMIDAQGVIDNTTNGPVSIIDNLVVGTTAANKNATVNGDLEVTGDFIWDGLADLVAGQSSEFTTPVWLNFEKDVNINGNAALKIRNGNANSWMGMDDNELASYGSGLYLNYDSGTDVFVGKYGGTTNLEVNGRINALNGIENPEPLNAGDGQSGFVSVYDSMDVIGGDLSIKGSNEPTLTIEDNANNGQRPNIKFKGNDLSVIQSDDTATETFGIYSKFSNNRAYDAVLKIFGKASGSWGKFLQLTHDGTNGIISTDSGNVVINNILDVPVSIINSSVSQGGMLQAGGQSLPVLVNDSLSVAGGILAEGPIIAKDGIHNSTGSTAFHIKDEQGTLIDNSLIIGYTIPGASNGGTLEVREDINRAASTGDNVAELEATPFDVKLHNRSGNLRLQNYNNRDVVIGADNSSSSDLTVNGTVTSDGGITAGGPMKATRFGTYAAGPSSYITLTPGEHDDVVYSCPNGQQLISCGYFASDKTTMEDADWTRWITITKIIPDTINDRCTVWGRNNNSSATRYLRAYGVCLDPDV